MFPELRTYIWEGGKDDFDLDGDGTIAGSELTTPWCFEFGESEWLTDVTLIKAHEKAKLKDKNGVIQIPERRVKCP